MTTLKHLFLTLSLAVGSSAQAALWSSTDNTVIPETFPNGLSSSIDVTGMESFLTSISINLDVSGGFNGDLYATLVHLNALNQPVGFAVLMNRAGVTGSDAFGYSDAGFQITLVATGAPDIHLYQSSSPTYNGGGQLIGTWAADGRNDDPLTVTDASAVNAGLNQFAGVDPNGRWTLFFADAVSSETSSTLNGWSIDITSTVPEPATVAAGIFGGLFALTALGRRLLSSARKQARPTSRFL